MEAADGLPPVVQLMSMLRQTVENLRIQDYTQVDNDNVQETQAQVQGDAAPVEETVSPPAGAAVAAEQVGESSSSTQPAPDLLPTAA
jgi:hypothetical protein